MRTGSGRNQPIMPNPLHNTSSVPRTLAEPTLVEAAAAEQALLAARMERLAARIELAIRRQVAGKIHDLKIDVSEESVVLSGACRTYYSKQLAQHAAMSVSGCPTLVNEIVVK
jgi:osmotically-inducible protein OsmY